MYNLCNRLSVRLGIILYQLPFVSTQYDIGPISDQFLCLTRHFITQQHRYHFFIQAIGQLPGFPQ